MTLFAKRTCTPRGKCRLPLECKALTATEVQGYLIPNCRVDSSEHPAEQ